MDIILTLGGNFRQRLQHCASEKIRINYQRQSVAVADHHMISLEALLLFPSCEQCLSSEANNLKIKDVHEHALYAPPPQLDNLTLMEINTIRSFFLDSLNCMYKLRSNMQPSGDTKGRFTDY